MSNTVAGNLEMYPHWAETDARYELVQVVADLGLRGENVPAILGVERVTDFEGTVEEACDVLIDWAAQHRLDLRDELQPQDAHHSEAQAIAWTEVYTPDGQRINVTARQGATPDDIVATVLALTDALDTMKAFGLRPTRQAANVKATQRSPKVRNTPGPTEFWGAVRKHIGEGKAFSNKAAVTNWLSQFATGKGYNWIAAIKALSGL